MILSNKTAIIYGGSGAIGSAIARAFYQAGANIFLVARDAVKLERVAAEIGKDSGRIHTDTLDVLDETAVHRHVAEVVKQTGRIDISVNVTGTFHIQGVSFPELSLEDFLFPVTTYIRANFITAQAAAKFMIKQKSGVLLSISTPGSKLPGTGFMGYGLACSGIEALNRHFAGELGAYGIRSLCLRPDAMPEAAAHGSHSNEVFAKAAGGAGISIADMLEQHAQANTLLKRLPTLEEVANAALFMASDQASAITGTVINLTCGSMVD
ncbi:SDR family NAD(P)-dependent oxidoreductase [Pseudobacter ginsenosidimutans]|uniref:NAD(P)-dependent dehydrogenase (Short-subunit alcohol dehydrogenase family) n=1 Tax=Pseudobacter ginsenosidimutans TaxID=661488 RepID=A0A4Q7MUD7_9BACT|nr:SDR family oxidoreductase [Pseudobacter ginsenosidimutans]QEC42446.1 SDR family oxidoreductase [Pseudobacter ginsenosidimutans]RZS70703.1 NAD(P)-dependent dehydrogenase (short-subunit alcohol dehydrogenase family) [Pseudobacter ginsenosidimutans]